jgi:hypothetical protein
MKTLFFLFALFFSWPMAGQDKAVDAADLEQEKAKDTWLLGMFLDSLLDLDNKYVDAVKRGKADERDRLLRAMYVEMFRLWIFYRGPDAVRDTSPEHIETILKRVRPGVPLMLKLENWNDPIGLRLLLEDIPPGGSVADIKGFRLNIPRLKLERIKSVVDYNRMIAAFHQWLVGQ